MIYRNTSKISGVILTKDSVNVVAERIANLQELCSEVVVIDTGSKDGTQEAARRAGARVVEFTWVEDFSAARNFAHEQVRGDWVFFLDTDWELKNLGDLQTLDLHSYDEIRLEWVNQWDADQKLSVQPRTLLYRSSQYAWRGRMHEYLEYTSPGQPRIGASTAEVWHHWTPDSAKELEYTRLLRLDLAEIGAGEVRTRTLMFLAQSLSTRGEWAGIVELLMSELAELRGRHSVEVFEYLAVALMKTGQARDQAGVIEPKLTAMVDPRGRLILGDLYVGFAPETAAKHYLGYLDDPAPEPVARRNWERYRVYPYIMLGNLSMQANPTVAAEFFALAAAQTRLTQKKLQLEGLVANLRQTENSPK